MTQNTLSSAPRLAQLADAPSDGGVGFEAPGRGGFAGRAARSDRHRYIRTRALDGS
jgi:hypothetical protein